MRFIQAALLLAIAAWAGCGDYDLGKTRGRSAAPEAVGVVVNPDDMAAPVGGRSPRTPPAEKTAPQAAPPAASATSSSPRGPAPKSRTGLPGNEVEMPYEAPSTENMIREKAEVGMGAKGHYKPGMITTPLATFWRAQEAAAYKIQVPQALNLYKGMHGYFPKTQEEFVREILEPNRIKLPDLPAGHIYVYDPDTGELQVARPK